MVLIHALQDVQPANLQLTSESPFMNLPVEIRLLIYSFLNPNTRIASGTRYFDIWVPLEREGEPCSLALLQTNRQIYHETVESLYKSATYSAWLTYNNLRFVNRDFASIPSLPFGFRFITSLSLTVRSIDLGLWCEKGPQCSFPPEHAYTQHLKLATGFADFFSPSGPGNLQTLELTIFLKPMYFLILGPCKLVPNPRDTIWKSLEFNFHLLRRIRASRSVRINEFKENRSMTNCPGGVKNEVLAVKREYFDSLIKDISGKYDE
jgi:hypothetical protein